MVTLRKKEVVYVPCVVCNTFFSTDW